MSDIIIRVENVGKSYIIDHQKSQRYTALRDVVTDTAKGIAKAILDGIRGNQGVGSPDKEEFWALDDISFEVKKGETLGIVGRNGAGKSTLLKVLSRITEPTRGRITLNGRVASLLEVGTGFHPELTGRENIFLNGAILGMSRAEIKKKFDEIVDFSGVEKFLDTPVKRYSSGMYVRLAFSVAAHLEPEILVVDEVLAVGDSEFQKKCLGKMKDVSTNDGRTVLFVSHNMPAVQNLCTQGLLLKNGTVVFNGNIERTIENYLNTSDLSNSFFYKADDKPGKQTQILFAAMVDQKGEPCQSFGNADDIYLDLHIKNLMPIPGLRCCVAIFDILETLITVEKYEIKDTGMQLKYRVKIKGGNLIPNTLKLGIVLDVANIELVDRMPDFLNFTVEDLNTEVRKYGDKNNGYIYPNMDWILLMQD